MSEAKTLAELTSGHGLLSLITFLPLIGALVILSLPRERQKLIEITALVFAAMDLLLCVPLVVAFGFEQAGIQLIDHFVWIKQFNIEYFLGVDGLSMPLVVLTSFLMFLSIIYSRSAVRERVKEYYALFLLLGTGMIGTFCALDFVLFYIFWEVSLVPMYFLIGIWGGTRREYASIKFFLYTLVGSVAMLVSILWMYFKSEPHTFNMVDLTNQAQASHMMMGAGVEWVRLLVFAGFFLAFAIKVPAFPFHTWLPDAHVEAPTAGSVILAGVLLKMGTYGLIRIALPMFPDAAGVFWQFIAVIALINIIYGALVAMGQTDLKKLIAYSSIGHMGFVMLGIAAAARPIGDIGAKVMALNGATIVMIAHGLITGALFLLIGVIYERAHHREIKRFGGLWGHMPVYGGVFVFMAMASLGLPPLPGFWGEFMVIMGSFKIFPWAGFAVIGIVLTAMYMLMTVQRVILGPAKDEYKGFSDMDRSERGALLPLVAAVFIMGVLIHLVVLPYVNVAMQTTVGLMQPR